MFESNIWMISLVLIYSVIGMHCCLLVSDGLCLFARFIIWVLCLELKSQIKATILEFRCTNFSDSDMYINGMWFL